MKKYRNPVVQIKISTEGSDLEEESEVSMLVSVVNKNGLSLDQKDLVQIIYLDRILF